MEKKPYLVDVPVCMMIWIRPELQKQTFAPIKQARPSVLFLSSDGGRNDEEWEKIRQNRAYLESQIDWDCTLYTFYSDRNYGLYTNGRRTLQYIFERVDRVIFFEDDTIADPSYFPFCAELLEKYKDDTRISSINGINLLQTYDAPVDYAFLNYGWGTGSAIWKRSLELYEKDDWLKDPYISSCILASDKKQFGSRHQEALRKRIETLIATGQWNHHPLGSEEVCAFERHYFNKLTIIPTKNMVRQMGATDDATHGVAFKKLDRKSQRYYTMPLYEATFPIRHPLYVIEDVRFKKALAAQTSGALERRIRKFITRCKRLYYGDGKAMWNSFVKRYIKKDRREE